MSKILLIGGGGHCKSVIDVIEMQGDYEIFGIIDLPDRVGSSILNYKVIGTDSDLSVLSKKCKFALITLGQIYSFTKRVSLFRLAMSFGFEFPRIISPKAYISKHSSIGEGTVVMHNAVINANSTIGKNCIINSLSLVEHDCQISDHCHISTNAIINGEVRIGQKCFIGSNAVVRESTTLEENKFIKAGTLFK